MKNVIAIIILLLLVLVGYMTYGSYKNFQNRIIQPEEISNIEKTKIYYAELKIRCALMSNLHQASCCEDSVKAMQVVGGTLYSGANNIPGGCKAGFKQMSLRCPGSYTWCQTNPNNGIDDNITPPVPQTIPQINSDKFKEIAICTDDAKRCKDGSYVGRTGPRCEFAKCPGKILPHLEPADIKLPDNIISEKDCSAEGGEIWNTLGETSYDGELIGKVEGLRCPCVCLVKSEPSNVIWVNVNGNLEEFKGNLDDIKTFDDCAGAGFQIKEEEPETCTAGEPHMTGGRYKTFTNNPIGAEKVCIDYHYSTCPGSCVATCKSSSCSEPDESGTVACTADCDGAGSCIKR